jgi:hypothetical protein
MRRSLGQRLVPVADRLRALLTDFGLRPYTVSIVRTRWTGGRRGVGEEVVVEEIRLRPTPAIADMTGVSAIASPAGLAEQGEILLSKISGTMTEEQLRGISSDGTAIDADEQFFYEIHFPRVDGSPGERRRFFPTSAPYYNAGGLQWQVQLRKQNAERQRGGDVRR